MGETISTLVFRPPPPTYLRPNRYFFLDVKGDENESSLGCGATSSGPKCVSHKVPAFFIKRRGARVTFLFSHGNAEDLGMMYNRMKEMARVLGVNILAYDYSGYGHSTVGQPSEDKCYRNIQAAYNYLRKDRKIPASHIVLYGRSLGSGPSCYLAAKTAREGESIAGLILHSPFLSIFRIVVDCGFNLVGDIFKNISNAPSARCPVLLIHGTRDEVVPFWHGDQLLQKFPDEYRAEPFWVDGMGHNNIEVYAKKEYVARVTAFLNRYIPANCNGVKSHIQVPTGRYQQEPGICWPIPKHERYVPGTETEESKPFFINSTWLKYGAEIVNEAVNSKREIEKSRIQKGKNNGKGAHNNIGTRTKMEDGKRVDTVSSSDLFTKLEGKAKSNDPENNFLMINDDDQSTASRFAMTRDRIVSERASDDDGEERDTMEDDMLMSDGFEKQQLGSTRQTDSNIDQDMATNHNLKQSLPQKVRKKRFNSKSPSRRRCAKPS